MSEVVSLADVKAEREAQKPHVSGEAKCLDCRHEWVAVAPTGNAELTCPKCETQRGVWRSTITPGSQFVWVCNCGNDLFGLTPKGPYCVKCGDWPEEFAR